MSITKNQLDAIDSGLLDSIGIDNWELTGGSVMEQVLQNVAQIMTLELRAAAVKKDLKATGSLIQGIDPTQSTSGADGVNVSIRMPLHWRPANFGTPAGTRPKVSDIEKWITAKRIPIRTSRSQSLKTVMRLRNEAAKRISTSIFKKGTIKRFNYGGSYFIEDIINRDTMDAIGDKVLTIAGKNIRVFIQHK